MSLPNYLAKIKSAGVYRFTWDKSVVPPQQAETLRLLIGYSEKGPFNTPVYVESVSEFKTIFGNISKRLERKGCYFHRMAEQALQSGPILAFNIKPFDLAIDTIDSETEKINQERVNCITFDSDGKEGLAEAKISDVYVSALYSGNRFWTLNEDKLIEKIDNNKYVTISATDTKDSSCTIFIRKAESDSYKGITVRQWYASQNIEYPDYVETILDEDLSEFFGEIYVFKGEFTEVLCRSERTEYGEDGKVIKVIPAGSLSKYFNVSYDDKGKLAKIALKKTCENVMKKEVDALNALANDSRSNFVGSYFGCTLPYFKDANNNYISLDIKFNADYTKHKMLMKFDASQLEELDNGKTVNDLLILPKDMKEFTPYYLQGYTYKSIDKTSDIWRQCKVVLSYPGIYEALTNRVDAEYHYIIDTFDTETNDNKAELFSLAKDKDNAFAIVNFPKMSKITGKDFAEDGVDGSIDLQETMKKYTLPGESEGASYGAYYTQLTFTDGTIKSVIPSAAIVSNNFMQKWGPRQPYYIVAGPNYGALSYSGMVGPDYNFGRSDLDILEPKGINAIVYVPRLGTYINSNQTAKQIPVSGLSKIHIRELVIYLQNEVEHLLQSYQWELNTQPLRDTIKAKADAICDRIMNNGGLYAYQNICDETNNTPETIDNEMIILDTEIEPARGAGKMVHQLTIHKTGGMTSKIK